MDNVRLTVRILFTGFADNLEACYNFHKNQWQLNLTIGTEVVNHKVFISSTLGFRNQVYLKTLLTTLGCYLAKAKINSSLLFFSISAVGTALTIHSIKQLHDYVVSSKNWLPSCAKCTSVHKPNYVLPFLSLPSFPFKIQFFRKLNILNRQ